MKILWSFLGVTSVLSYIKYYVDDSETAITHLGLICSGFTVAVYGSPLVSLVRKVYFHFHLKKIDPHIGASVASGLSILKTDFYSSV